jgi:hypothetical protein
VTDVEPRGKQGTLERDRRHHGHPSFVDDQLTFEPSAHRMPGPASPRERGAAVMAPVSSGVTVGQR